MTPTLTPLELKILEAIRKYDEKEYIGEALFCETVTGRDLLLHLAQAGQLPVSSYIKLLYLL